MEENLLQSARKLQIGTIFTFHRDNNPKHKAKATQKWLKHNNVNLLMWSHLISKLNPSRDLWLGLQIIVHSPFPCTLIEHEKNCKGKWKEIPVYLCTANLKDVIATNVDQTLI